MKKVGLIATIVIAAMLIAGCGNSNNADNKTTVNESLAVSSSVGNTENNNSEIVKENQSSTEVTTTELTTADTTTRKETTATQKESACWTRLKSASKVYPDSKLTRRLDKLSGLYLASSHNNNLVEQKIASSSFYRSQLGLN